MAHKSLGKLHIVRFFHAFSPFHRALCTLAAHIFSFFIIAMLCGSSALSTNFTGEFSFFAPSSIVPVAAVSVPLRCMPRRGAELSRAEMFTTLLAAAVRMPHQRH